MGGSSMLAPETTSFGASSSPAPAPNVNSMAGPMTSLGTLGQQGSTAGSGPLMSDSAQTNPISAAMTRPLSPVPSMQASSGISTFGGSNQFASMMQAILQLLQGGGSA